MNEPFHQTDLEVAFRKFHSENPHVYDKVKDYTFMAIGRGFDHLGIKMVWERVRWFHYIETVADDEFKLNNNHTAYYARMFMSDHMEHEGFFRTRSVRTV